MRRISLLWKVVRITYAERFAVGYVLLLFLVAVAVWLAEPSITTLADSLWYCFAASTTIGFGDLCSDMGRQNFDGTFGALRHFCGGIGAGGHGELFH